MKIKRFQASVLEELQAFLGQLHCDRTIGAAFRSHWLAENAVGMPPYRDTLPGVPHVCIKVPTGGGKTYIAANALKPIFEWRGMDGRVRPKLVVWLAPSLTIVNQTLRALRDPAHPFRQPINSGFQRRIEVYDKEALLQGASFSPDAIRDQLSILVLSYDSLKSRAKDNRKLHEDNGALLSFVGMPDLKTAGTAAPSVIDVVQAMAPVVIVDESHNATTPLSRDMLADLAPSFVLDLTATPRQDANIISYVDALALKNEGMVKLPVIVHNRPNKDEVYADAIDLQARLEREAVTERTRSGRYIRPIVLFQAESRTGKEDRETFEKVRERLMAAGIPEGQIKIKTAEIDEIKGIDLLAEDCPVRFIITVNALKEGWDCSFAYVLASLADRSSAVDVEQILGRVLRQPYAVEHGIALLNMSYVLTASAQFDRTVRAVVDGLKAAGFSDRDYRIVEDAEGEASNLPAIQSTLFNHGERPASAWSPSDISGGDVRALGNSGGPGTDAGTPAPRWLVQAEGEAKTFNERAREAQASGHRAAEVEAAMGRKAMMPAVSERARLLELPQFHLHTPKTGLLADFGGDVLLERDNLLDGFQLAKCDADINFDALDQSLVEVDVEKTDGGSRPSIRLLNARREKALVDLIRNMPEASRVREITGILFNMVGSLPPVTDPDVRQYVRRILETMTPSEVEDCITRPRAYAGRIKEKIKGLMTAHASSDFQRRLRIGSIFLKPSFRFPPTIAPVDCANPYVNSMYEAENKINGLEEEAIRLICDLPNLVFWHRNWERGHGFRLNGAINHYPDFVLLLKSGVVVLLETKGDDRDNTEAADKLDLGRTWADKAGDRYRYAMVFKTKEMEGALRLDKFIRDLREM